MGSDVPPVIFTNDISVSIHAPVWGATHNNPYSNKNNQFQSTLPYGERHEKSVSVVAEYGFNPRSRMGSDNMTGINCQCFKSFNPRSRMGSDQSKTTFNVSLLSFQSTLPYGERRITKAVKSTNIKFQSTLPYGERPLKHLEVPDWFRVSIHAPVWGATAITYNFSTIFRDCLCNYNNIIVLIQAY